MAVPGLDDTDLLAAVDAGVIDVAAFERLSTFLSTRRAAVPLAHPPRFDFVNVLWYLGALIVLSAMGLFTTNAFGLWGAPALVTTSTIYGLVFLALGTWLWRKRDLQTPGGLLIACAIGMVPLLIFGLQSIAGYEPEVTQNYHDFYVWIRSSWLFMEIATIFAALLALIFFPFPFLVMPLAFAAWFLSMDLTPWLSGTADFTWEQRANVSMAFGALMLVIAWFVDLKRWRGGDFAFWLHLFGLLAFWGGLTAQSSSSEAGKAVYCLINIGLVFLGLFLMRRAYAVFGGVGVTLYLGHLAEEVFQDSILFPFALSGIGVVVIGMGLLFHRHGRDLAASLSHRLPASLMGLRPVHARESSP
jgi:hypothetical protein